MEPSYLMDRGEPLFDGEPVEALWNRTVREATREISRLPEKERQLVLAIVRQFGSENKTSSRRFRRNCLVGAGLRPSARRPGSR